MKRLLLPTAALISIVFNFPSFAETASKEHSETEHEKHEGHEGHDDHGDDESSGSVGPDKGILEASERTGFKLSPEALKTFDLKLMKLTGKGPWTLPKSALVHSGEEVNLFRLRSGFFKRVDFKTVRKSGSELTVDSNDLREGDEIVLIGQGFLRVAELAAFGGVAHGHSH